MNPKIEEIKRLAEEYAKEVYREGALDNVNPIEVACLGLGQALSKIAHYHGSMIAAAAAEAFEDANFHEKAAELREWAGIGSR